MIQTVLGKIPADDLGVCLPHEHIWCNQNLGPKLELMDRTRDPATFMRHDNFDYMVSELKAYKSAGGGAIIEVTCDGWGRNLDTLARLSEASEVHIIATSGYYIEPHIPLFIYDWSVDKIADHITREVLEGVAGGQRRCGIFKSAIHRARVEGPELKVLKAVAIAQKRTGAAITTHSTATRRMEVREGVAGAQQWKILESEGVDPTKFIVGHVDQRPDIDVLSGHAGRGCYVQFDVIDKEQFLLDDTRADLVHALIQRGYTNRVMLSQDRTRDTQMRYGGHTGYCHIFEDFLPRLRKRGVTDEQIHTIMVKNPARVLSID